MKRRFQEYLPRACEVCGSDKYHVLHHFIDNINENGCIVEIDVTLVSCSRCGFVFMNPAPAQDELNCHYANVIPQFQSEILYSIENRLSVIKKYYPGNGAFLEIGGNDSNVFHSHLRGISEKIHSVDVNAACSPNGMTSLSDLGERQDISMVAMYYVLEHVPALGQFLGHAVEVLQPEGYLIIEVPNIQEYAYDISAFVWSEHVNHFSPFTLARLCANHGLDLIYLSKELCSRPFGFVAVFKKKTEAEFDWRQVEKFYNAACLASAQRIAARREKNRMQLINSLHGKMAAGESIAFWCANAVCSSIIHGFDEQYGGQAWIVVDSDRRKKNYFGRGIQVLTPSPALLRECEIIIICSSSAASPILVSITDMGLDNIRLYYVDDEYRLVVMGAGNGSLC